MPISKSFNPITGQFQPLTFNQCVQIFHSHHDWIVQEAPAAPWFWWIPSAAWTYGLTSAGYSIGDFLTFCEKEVGTLVVSRETFMRQAKRLVRSELAGQSVIDKWRRLWREQNKNYHMLVKRVTGADLSLWDEQDFLQLFKDFCQVYYAVEYLPLSNEFFIPYTDKLLNELMLKYPGHSAAIAGLLVPKKKSFMQTEEAELLALKKLPNIKQIPALLKHAAKWYFIGSGYDGAHAPSVKDLKNKMVALKLNQPHYKQHKFPPSLLDSQTKIILRLARKITEWKDARKKNNLIGSYLLDKFAHEFSRRYYLPVKLVRYSIPAEFLKIKNGDPRYRRELSKRLLTGVGWGMSGFRYSGLLTGWQYAKIKQDISSLKQSKETLVGIAACPGKAIGRVRIIHNPAKEKLKSGEILVTSMTRPEFVPPMKIARAVLCDEGGLLSHAAIVSRELGVPCIVGLKHAMAALKDGDLVEVDAGQGVVRKLDKHQSS